MFVRFSLLSLSLLALVVSGGDGAARLFAQTSFANNQAKKPAVEPAKGVVVVANRSRELLRAEVRSPLPSVTAISLEPGELASVPFRDGAELRNASNPAHAYRLAADQVYVATDRPGGGWICQQVEFSAANEWTLPPARNVQAVLSGTGPLRVIPRDKSNVIRVEVYVDEDEAAAQPVWEKRLRQRLAAAGQVLDYHCGLTIEVVAIRRWTSDNAVTDFHQSLAEFERTAKPNDKSDLIIGFTSQYELKLGKTHLGGTRGGLAPHILLREYSKKMSEVEKLEVLIHELGHYLGAGHSIEQQTVMRPILADRQARERHFRILFDPLNTLAMNIVARDYRARGARFWHELGPTARAKLLPIYAEINKAFPTDPAAADYLSDLGAVPAAARRGR